MKLKALLESSGKDASGLAHTLAIINDEAKEYLPSGTTLEAKLGALKMVSKQAICYTGSGADAALGDLQLAASRAFPGSVGHDEHEALQSLQMAQERHHEHALVLLVLPGIALEFPEVFFILLYIRHYMVYYIYIYIRIAL